MTISSWLNFGRSAPPERGSATGRKFLAPPYYSHARSVCVSLSAFFHSALLTSSSLPPTLLTIEPGYIKCSTSSISFIIYSYLPHVFIINSHQLCFPFIYLQPRFACIGLLYLICFSCMSTKSMSSNLLIFHILIPFSFPPVAFLNLDYPVNDKQEE